MNLLEVEKGQLVFDKTSGERVEVTAVGDRHVMARYVLGGEDFEVSYREDEISATREWPELVVNVYRTDPFGLRAPRVFADLQKSHLDPDWQYVIGQILLQPSGVCVMVPFS